MQDPLDALRRAYGESDAPPERLAPEAQAEVDAILTLKTGLDALAPQRPDAATLRAVFAAAETIEALDALPPQRPDAATFAAVLAAAEEAPLASVRSVYGDEDAVLDTDEAATFAALKSGLDALPRHRPAAATLGAVFAAAAATAGSAPAEPATAPADRRTADRAPRRLVTRRRLTIAASAAFALLLTLTSGLWLPSASLTAPGAEEQLAQAQERDEPEADAPEESADNAAREVAEVPVAAAPVAPAPPASSQSASPVAARSAARTAPAAPEAVASVARPSADRARRAAPTASDIVVPEAEVAAAFASNTLADQAEADRAPASDEALPLADGEDALRQLYLRTLEIQAAQTGLGWDGPPEALGVAPDSLPTATGWMQVRVER